MDRLWPGMRFMRRVSMLVAGVLLLLHPGLALPASQENTPSITLPAKDVIPPVPLHHPEPPYSEKARRKKVQGIVTMWLTVDEQGKVTNVELIKSLEKGLDKNAIKACRTWTFTPATRNGVPVSVRVRVQISFRLF